MHLVILCWDSPSGIEFHMTQWISLENNIHANNLIFCDTSAARSIFFVVGHAFLMRGVGDRIFSTEQARRAKIDAAKEAAAREAAAKVLQGWLLHVQAREMLNGR